ncbi:MAG: hypothetical protein E7267_04700 [Lachnospiraceae bacterium]|nr:hypothetical protein [Lachnospiraceae bacterium]
MKLSKISGPAMFMYCVIAICVVISTICFALYYKGINSGGVILWTGVTAFTIMYHFWVRIIMGNVSKLFRKYVNYRQWWFREKKFEKSLYRLLRVKSWKDKALTYNPELFSLKERSLEELADTMTKAELDHWLNQIIAISTIFFSLIWGQLWIFLITAVAAMLFDGQFIVIQRFNRPRLVRILEKSKH